MEEEKNDLAGFTPEMQDYIGNLVDKSRMICDKTKSYANTLLCIGDQFRAPLKVDDFQLLFIGSFLLPNIINYLVNILPQFLYPYVVAYLQDLSAMREDPITINELYNYLTSKYYNYGNLHECSEAEG